MNIVEGNVMWQCGDSGIQAAADAVIRNNIILESPGSSGFNSQPHQGAVPSNLQFVHNTIVGGDPVRAARQLERPPGLVFANNAIYCDADNFVISGLSGVVVTGNVIAPPTSAFPSSGYRTGQARALDLLDVAGKNVYPTASPDYWMLAIWPRGDSTSTEARAVVPPMRGLTNGVYRPTPAGSWHPDSRARTRRRRQHQLSISKRIHRQ